MHRPDNGDGGGHRNRQPGAQRGGTGSSQLPGQQGPAGTPDARVSVGLSKFFRLCYFTSNLYMMVSIL